jgi:hypothetical protein
MQPVLFEDIEKEIVLLKRNFHINAVKYFSTTQVTLFERLVFDLTHKDFEYFLCHILEKEGYMKPHVTDKGLDKRGVDIIAIKNGVIHLFQCKQWSSKYIDIKKIGESYAKLFDVKRSDYPDAELHFVTTSFLNSNAREFLEIHKVNVIANVDIIDYAMKYMLQDKENWEKLIEFIQYQRIGKMLGKYNQERLFVGITDIKEKLWQQRLDESAMHTTNYRL